MPRLPDEHIEIKFEHLPKNVQTHLLETGNGPIRYLGPKVKMREFLGRLETVLQRHGLVANEHAKAYPLLQAVNQQLMTHSVKIVNGNIHLDRKTNFDFIKIPKLFSKNDINPFKQKISGIDPMDKILGTRKPSPS